MEPDRAALQAKAAALGLPLLRVAPAEPLREAARAARDALDAGRLAGLHWMTAAWLQRAADPQQFLAGASSVIVVGLPYARPAPPAAADARPRGRVAAYAAGRDYHRVFEGRLRRLATWLREGGAAARATVDYGPLLERPLAERAGLGWRGKSTMLLAPGFGPRLLLGAVATSLPFAPDAPLRKSCGSCTRCIVACPTGAISPDGGLLDARRCISYHTIENRGPIPRDLRPLFGDWVFGCDECLDACPVGATNDDAEPEFAARAVDDAFPLLANLLSLDEEGFRERFRGRALMRAKRDGLARNACVALGNVGGPGDVALLVRALDDTTALVRGHAAWALAAIAGRHPTARDQVRVALAARLAREDEPSPREELLAALASLAFDD